MSSVLIFSSGVIEILSPSSKISSEKKKAGHKNEVTFAKLIGGVVKKGTRKGDVLDRFGNLHSVKGGKKWQIFLYTLGRISKCLHLNILKPCIESFPDNYDQYLKDRISCISYKETLQKYTSWPTYHCRWPKQVSHCFKTSRSRVSPTFSPPWHLHS